MPDAVFEQGVDRILFGFVGRNDVADATQKAVEAKPSLEEKGTKKSDMTTEAEDAEKNGESKPEVASMATKEGASATIPEGAEENGAVKGGE